jgi:hypothetical protein
MLKKADRLCGLVAGFLATGPEFRVLFPALPDYLSSWSGTGSTQPRECNWGATWKSSDSGLENWEYGRRNPWRWLRGTLYPQKLTLTSPTSGGRSVGIVRSRTQVTEFYCLVYSGLNLFLFILIFINCICIVFVVCSVSLIFCSYVRCVLFERDVLFYVMSAICVLCLIVVSLAPGKIHLQLK